MRDGPAFTLANKIASTKAKVKVKKNASQTTYYIFSVNSWIQYNSDTNVRFKGRLNYILVGTDIDRDFY